MMKPSEAVGALRTALEDIDDHLEALDDAPQHVENAKVELKTIQDQKSQALADVRTVKSEHERAMAANVQKLAEANAEALNQAKAHQDQIAALQQIHDDLAVKVSSLQQHHDNLLASIESLKKKFA